MTLKTIIIDDEPLARELIKSYIERLPVLELCGSFNSATEAIKAIVSGKIDLIFLDINMPCVNGIEMAQITPPDTRIVYVTAYDKYALKAFESNALDYLLKPVSFETFTRAVNRAVEWKKMSQVYHTFAHSVLDHIVVKSDYKTVQICLSDIIYIEGRRDYVRIVLDTEPHEYVSLINLKRMEGILPSDRFMRVHRSFIVNLHKIKLIDRAAIVFGEMRIPITDAYKERFTEYLRSHSVAGIEAAQLLC